MKPIITFLPQMTKNHRLQMSSMSSRRRKRIIRSNNNNSGCCGCRQIFCLIVLLGLVGAYWKTLSGVEELVLVQQQQDTTKKSFFSSSSSSLVTSSSTPVDFASVRAKYDHCQISWNNQTQQYSGIAPTDDANRKPLWMPSFPNSIDESIMKGIVSRMTGYGMSAARSFYVQSKTFKKCQGQGKVALCLLIHPMLESKPSPTAKQYKDNFHSNFIYGIRNPATTIPSFHNGKQIKYHGQKGQVPENEWRNYRDKYLETTMKAWKNQLRYWKQISSTTTSVNNNYYSMQLYVAYEKLMNANGEGVSIVQELLKVLQQSGIDIAVKDDMDSLGCLWYQGIGFGMLNTHRLYNYEYTDYIPGYTQQQKEFLLQELQSFIEENKDDAKLIDILKFYYQDIQQNIKIDIPWVAPAADASR